jgi:hypothetical protein
MAINGQQLWNRRRVTIPASSQVTVAHGLQQNVVYDPQDIQVVYCAPLIGFDLLTIDDIDTINVTLTNTDGSPVTVNILFWLPHTAACPCQNDAYGTPNSIAIVGV